MDLTQSLNLSTVTVFLEGILSFFSPCVLPLIPVYFGYLSGGTLRTAEDGSVSYDRGKVILNTLFFVLGVGMAFLLLGLGISAAGKLFSGNRLIFARIGGIIVVLFGLYQVGFMGESRLLSGQYRLPIHFEKMTMSPLTALIMGFVLSFAWSPCVGPVLSSVLILAASAGSQASGFALIGVYTLGYAIPFILVGFFTASLLDFFGRHRNVVKYTVKIGGALLILMGTLMFTGKLNSITGYLSTLPSAVTTAPVTAEEETETSSDAESAEALPSHEETVKEVAEELTPAEEVSPEEAESTETEKVAAPDFTLTDQYGESHSLADYRGKIIFLNFWATWCPPCKAELPYIQELYEEYQAMEDPDVVFLGVAFPGLGSEQDVAGVTQFLEDNGYSFPVLMDEEASLMLPYYITAYPTTFLIDPEGNVLGYIPGGMTKEIMESVIQQARDLSE